MTTEKQPRCCHTVDQHTRKQVQHKPLFGSNLNPIEEHRNSSVRFCNFSNKSRSCIFIQNLSVKTLTQMHMEIPIYRPDGNTYLPARWKYLSTGQMEMPIYQPDGNTYLPARWKCLSTGQIQSLSCQFTAVRYYLQKY